MDWSSTAQKYKTGLLDQVIPFWENYSRDEAYGGYFICLDRRGVVYDTDKFVWLQGRQVWMFATLYNRVEKRPQWLDMAWHGARFMHKHGHDGRFNWYFSLTREGRPLIQPCNIFSDCFAAMAFGQLFAATGDEQLADIARKTFENIIRRAGNPKGIWNKAYPGTRPLKGFSLPMILCNLSLELEHLLERELVERTISDCIHEVMDVFYDQETGLIRENVQPDGSGSDSFEGRLLNPGHAIEAMWFIMDLSVRLGQPALAKRAVEIMLRTLNFGWDGEFGGIYYFLDCQGHPPQQLEWDQKLWWVHIETLISLIKGLALTGDPECAAWFARVHEYTWAKFPDLQYGEWFGYLNRRGEVLLPLKGGKWKGCFHVPRGLLQVWKTIDQHLDVDAGRP